MCAVGVFVLTASAMLQLKQVACGYAHTMAVTTDGRLFVWGCATDGRLGLGKDVGRVVPRPTPVLALREHRIVAVSCGCSHSAVVTAISTVRCRRVSRLMVE